VQWWNKKVAFGQDDDPPRLATPSMRNRHISHKIPPTLLARKNIASGACNNDNDPTKKKKKKQKPPVSMTSS